MYAATKTASAWRVYHSLSAEHAEEYDEIEERICTLLPALRASGIVVPRTLFGVDGFRYYDHVFPYLIFSEVHSDIEIISVIAILAAETRPPRQAWI